MKKEKNYLTCDIHYILCPWDINFDISQLLSIKCFYDSTFLFIFSNKKDSFSISLNNNNNRMCFWKRFLHLF